MGSGSHRGRDVRGNTYDGVTADDRRTALRKALDTLKIAPCKGMHGDDSCGLSGRQSNGERPVCLGCAATGAFLKALPEGLVLGTAIPESMLAATKAATAATKAAYAAAEAAAAIAGRKMTAVEKADIQQAAEAAAQAMVDAEAERIGFRLPE